jgi:uncharacterized SAM-binding protein YcdF (DUF218 family)
MPDPDRLAAAPEIIVVLGSKHHQVRRAKTAAALALERPGAAVILSGRVGFEPQVGPSEAEIMAGVMRESGVPADSLFLEDESRDTLGNALLTAVRYLRNARPRPLILVTSPFHMERSLFIFQSVLGPTWTITGHASEAFPGDESQVEPEQKYLSEVRSMLSGVEPGDLRSITARLRARWPEYYNEIKRLDL